LRPPLVTIPLHNRLTMKDRFTLPGASSFVKAGFLLVIAAVLVGCSKPPSGVRLTGKVVYKDKTGKEITLGGGTISLYKEGATTPEGSPIMIMGNGKFAQDGFPEGKYTVTIETESAAKLAPVVQKKNLPSEKKEAPVVDDAPPTPSFVKIPAKYKSAKTSGLTWEIKKDEPEKVFELTD
jgi:hypothetical protein